MKVRGEADKNLPVRTDKRLAPKQLAVVRQEHLLKIATTEFLGRGFDGASIDGIAQLAAVSKATIYKYYRNKEALFEAVVDAIADSLAMEPVELDASDVEGSLRAWGKAFQRANSSRQSVEVTRLIIAEAAKQPELVGKIRKNQIDHALDDLIRFFSLLQKQKKIIAIDPVELATNFSLAVSGGFRNLLGVSDTSRIVTRRIDNAVTMFLHGCLR